MNAIQISILSIVGVLMAVQFKSGKAEYGIFISVAISILIFYCILGRLKSFQEVFGSFQSYLNIDNTYLTTILKMIGITYVAEFASNICKETGYPSIASQIELFARLSLLVLSLPVMLTLFQTITSFLS